MIKNRCVYVNDDAVLDVRDDNCDDDEDDDDAAVIGDLILILFVLNHCLAFSICPMLERKHRQADILGPHSLEQISHVSYFNSVCVVCP